MVDPFFDEAEEHSVVKAEIVSKYFSAWANVVKGPAKRAGGKISYMDLFAGPGRYRSGSLSTPLLVLERAIEDCDLRRMLVAVFNDKDTNHSHSLKNEIEQLPGIDKLSYKPKVYCSPIDDKIVQRFSESKLVPTFSFVDPFGYKGLSLGLIQGVIKDWGCDCVFFFNYNRINMGISNDLVEEHIDLLFGTERAKRMRREIESMNSSERESHVLENIVVSLSEMGAKNKAGASYVLPFRFRRADGNRTSHYLIFVTKAFRGYDIMKGIMASASSTHTQGVPRFEYNPATSRQKLLFELFRPLDDLENMLLDEFAGRRIVFKTLYEQHSVGKPFLSKNYKDVLLRLDRDGRISTNPPSSKRRKDTFGDNVEIHFPARG